MVEINTPAKEPLVHGIQPEYSFVTIETNVLIEEAPVEEKRRI